MKPVSSFIIFKNRRQAFAILGFGVVLLGVATFDLFVGPSPIPLPGQIMGAIFGLIGLLCIFTSGMEIIEDWFDHRKTLH